MNAAAMFAVESITLRYRTRHSAIPAIDHLSFVVHQAERLAVIGRSGSGKTSLGRLLAGVPPSGAETAGRLCWLGERQPAAWSSAGRPDRRIAWIPQEAGAALHPQLRIGTQIEETQRGTGSVTAALAEVGLDAALASRYPHQISGGQAQRVVLACTLAQAPMLLVADEPTSALDDETGGTIVRLLHTRATERGMALLLITHDLRAAATCDRTLVLDGGRLVEDGLTTQVLRRPVSQAAQALLAAATGAPCFTPEV